MSKTSYVPVRFVGGPMGGTSREFAGEPKPLWTPKDGALNGSYRFEWDRGTDHAKLRSGVYTWDADTEAAPADGDAASALLEEVGPEKAAERLNSSGSSSLIQSGDASDDRKSQETGDNASAKAAQTEKKAAEKESVAAQAESKDADTSSGYDADESGANVKRPTSSASKGSSTKPATK